MAACDTRQVEPSDIAREGVAAIEFATYWAVTVPQLTWDAPDWLIALADEVHNLTTLQCCQHLPERREWSQKLEMNIAYRATRTAIVNEAIRRNRAALNG